MTQASGVEADVPDDAEIRRRLGRRIRELRNGRRLTQQALAERAGGRTSAKHVGAVERGKSAPRATLLVRIARGLEVTVGDLFSTITPGYSLLFPRDTISTARESLRSVNAILEVLERAPAPEGAPGYELPPPPPLERRQPRR